MERQLIADYRETITGLLAELNGNNYEVAVQLANLPAEIRGFGHVKEEAVQQARIEKEQLLQQFAREGATIASTGAVQYHEVG